MPDWIPAMGMQGIAQLEVSGSTSGTCTSRRPMPSRSMLSSTNPRYLP